jgi:putative Mn2+ efflux pump MntP
MKGITAFILLAFGTIGFILNEFIEMGTAAVLAFALSNIIGLTLLYFVLQKENEKRKESDQ